MSENEDGGVYFAPDLSVSISRKGTLIMHYSHGRYGYWAYKFRYQNSDFELIGYDSSSNRGPIVNEAISINFLTKKIKKKINTNPDKIEKEKLVETWRNFTLLKPIKLREIRDFDDFDIDTTF